MPDLKSVFRNLASFSLGIFFIVIGIRHFTDPDWFEPIVPKIIGNPAFWVYVSGIFEVVLGVAILHPKWRSWAGKSLAVLLVILYWANLNMWINNIPLDGKTYANHWHVLRALAQVLMIAMALWLSHTFRITQAVRDIEDVIEK